MNVEYYLNSFDQEMVLIIDEVNNTATSMTKEAYLQSLEETA
jgi:hypothetical protein